MSADDKEARHKEAAAVSRFDLEREFFDLLSAKLRRGAVDYGDRSFYEPSTPDEILGELLDVAGWAFVEWVKMRRRLQGLILAATKLEQSE